jgi:hypothetical protein
MTEHYAGPVEVARWCGVSKTAVHMWFNRYDDYPEPDAIISTGKGISRGWLPSRKAEWLAWHASEHKSGVRPIKGLPREVRDALELLTTGPHTASVKEAARKTIGDWVTSDPDVRKP